MSTIPNGISEYTIEERILLNPNDCKIDVEAADAFDFSAILSASKKVRLSSFQQKYKEFCEPKVREYEAKYRKNVTAIEAALRESRCDVLVPPFPSFHDRLARCRRSPGCRRSSGSC